MPKVLYFADPSNRNPGLGATILLDSGEKCVISIAQTSVRVKKPHLVLFGPVLYEEKVAYKAAATAKALDELFPASLLPPGFTHPVLSVFVNAILHCSSCAEVSITLNKAATSIPQATSAPPVPTSHPVAGGTTPDTAIKIHAANSLEGIPKEYAALRAMFGKPNKDWKFIERVVVRASGRTLEQFILSVAGKRKEIYFDITDWVDNNDNPETKAAFDAMVATRDGNLPVLLPKEELCVLGGGLFNLTEADIRQIGWTLKDRNRYINLISSALEQWKEYEKIPSHVSVTMAISDWVKIHSFLKMWAPDSLLQEEQLENLKAIIGGTMQAALSS